MKILYYTLLDASFHNWYWYICEQYYANETVMYPICSLLNQEHIHQADIGHYDGPTSSK